MKTIGILGGLGPESTIAYYAYVTRKYYETHHDYAYPETVIYSLTFKEFIDAEYELPDRVLDAIRKLAAAGAEFVVAACNSLHVVYDEVAPRTPIPWVSIMDATAEEIRRRGMHRVGLLGTVYTMGKGFYQRALARHGIEAIVPDLAAQQTVNQIIYGELVREVVTEASRKRVLDIMDGLVRQGAQGVILGCTELPFLIYQEHTPIPVFDTTAIHSQKALDLALVG
jgi:aspartate racemase